MASLGRVILAGGSGFLGTSLAKAMTQAGYEPAILTRGPDAPTTAERPRHIHWDAKTAGPWIAELDGAAAIVNLVGRSVDCRKTVANKQVILDSRLDSVRALAAGWAQVTQKPPVWVQASTAHIFGDTGDEVLDESSPIGVGFAPDVGSAWESAFNDAYLPGVRRVVLRMSFVVGQGGGAMGKLIRITRTFLGGSVGSGRQWISWIHEADLNAIVRRAIADATMSGVYVVTAPNPVTNAEFMRELRRTLHRPWAPPTPAYLVRIGARLMNTDPELALLGRRCAPTRLLREGFTFHFPDLGDALENVIVG